MRHRAKGRQLSRTSSHKRALLNNMAASLFAHERITTTEAKAKELRPFAERLITLARRGDLHARRLVERRIKNRDTLAKLFREIGPRFAARPGGYTRILKLGHREGDGADIARIESGQMSLSVEPVWVSATVQECLDLVRITAGAEVDLA